MADNGVECTFGKGDMVYYSYQGGSARYNTPAIVIHAEQSKAWIVVYDLRSWSAREMIVMKSNLKARVKPSEWDKELRQFVAAGDPSRPASRGEGTT